MNVNEWQSCYQFPQEFTSKEVNGTLLLYCPSDDSKDIKKDFTTNNSTITTALPPNAVKGSYQLQLSWIADGNGYYFEENLFCNILIPKQNVTDSNSRICNGNHWKLSLHWHVWTAGTCIAIER